MERTILLKYKSENNHVELLKKLYWMLKFGKMSELFNITIMLENPT
jgi:hypothetical protein